MERVGRRLDRIGAGRPARVVCMMVIWPVAVALMIGGTWIMFFLLALAGLALLETIGVVGPLSDHAHLVIASIVWVVWALACAVYFGGLLTLERRRERRWKREDARRG